MLEHIEASLVTNNSSNLSWQVLTMYSRVYPVFFPLDYESAVVFFIKS